jgi:muconate cycloisomerase
MKITDMNTMTVEVPMRRAHNTGVRATQRIFVIVRVQTDRNITGYGEATVLKEWGGSHMRYYGESYRTVSHVIRDYLCPGLQGEDPFAIENIHTRMDRIIKGHPYAKAAIDMALYDIMGKALNVPAYNLLGGLVRREVPLCHSIAFMLPEAAVAEARTVVEAGYRCIKIKVGLDPVRDVETVRQVREAVGPSVDLTIDGNQCYPTPKTAVRILKQMEPYNLLFAEQPVEGVDAMAAVAKSVDIPIMHDEGAWTPQDVLEIRDKGAGELISLYTTKPGGLFNAKKVAAVCEAAGFRCNVNGSLETGVGNAANLHLAASTRVVSLPCVVPVTAVEGRYPIPFTYYLDDIVKDSFEYHNGALVVSDAPGLGIELDEEKVEKYGVR